MKDRKITEGSIWRHYKGQSYKIICVGYNANSIEKPIDSDKLVVYESLYEDVEYGNYAKWVRCKKDFLSKVNGNKYRFIKMQN